MQITELLARRTDLSTFLVHLTRDSDDGKVKAGEKLMSIITSGTLKAGEPFGAAKDLLKQANLSTDSQRCVCFTETPLEHVGLLTEKIEEPRDCKFEPYGIAITRKQGRRLKVNPVWYLDMTPAKGHYWLTNSVADLVKAAIKDHVEGVEPFDDQPIANLAPFIDWMGVWPSGNRKEFWWEREWRYCGDFTLPPRYIILCPADEAWEFDAVLEHELGEKAPHGSYIDPSWSLEQIIGSLAGIPADELGPF
jgi:hypothetical protein